MRAPITLDLHLPNFNYPDSGPEQVFDRLIAIAETAERSGFSSISVMDHLHQIAMVGPQENWMFEGSTMLAALAARTSRLSLGLLVGGVTYRNPALHAKITTTIDIISKGRAWHGIGAAWFEEEHRAYGFAYPPLKVRFEMLEEHLQIVRAMFTSKDRTSFHGNHFHVEGAYNNPPPVRGDIPILIGGSGERKTLRLVARYADACNLFGDPDRIRHLIGVLERHCETVGRDPAEITRTCMGQVLIAPTHEAAQAKIEPLRRLGVPPERLDAAIAGDPDTVGERVQKLADAGAEGITISMPDVHDLEALELAGRTISKVFGTPTAAALD
jgi:F420-dependent oxidoreductase-like protein